MSRLDPAARVRRHIDEILQDGPVGWNALVDELVARDLNLGPDPEGRIDHVIDGVPRIEVMCPPGVDEHGDHEDLVFDRLVLLDGTTWTVPTNAVDIASDTIDHRMLGLLFPALLSEWCRLDDGGTVGLDVENRREAAVMDDPDLISVVDPPDLRTVTLPPGWFAAHGARPDGWLAVHVEGDTVSATPVDAPPQPRPAMVTAIRQILGADTEDPVTLNSVDVLGELLLDHPSFRGSTFPPLDDLYAAAGLDRDGMFLAPAGFDFATEHLRASIEDAANIYGLTEPQIHTYVALRLAWQHHLTGDTPVPPDDLAGAAQALGDLGLVATFIEDVVVDAAQDGLADSVVDFAEALRDTPGTPRRLRAVATWVAAQALAHAGRTAEFEDLVDIAHRDDPDHPGIVYDKAWFAFDRGEARKAKALLDQLGVGAVDHDLAILDTILTPQAPKVGRNEPCPCGSGRKYKHCHLGVDETALVDRLTWLYRKANWWLGFRHRPPVDAMAWVLSRHRPETPEELADADPLIADVALTEDGFFEEWLSERGALLPSDEAMLAHAWALVRRSVFQVSDVRPGEGLTVRDVRTGDVVDVDERTGSRGLNVGEYLLVRPLPTGDGHHQFFGGITRVPDVMLDRFLELLDTDPNAFELLRLVAESEAPPTMVNRDGEVLVSCETTWLLTDTDAARATLGALFGADEATADAWTWTADASDEPDPAVTAAGGHTVRGSLHLSGDLLVGETNSVERSERLRALIDTHLADATLVEALQIDADDAAADRDYERDVYGDPDDDPAGFSGLLDPVDAPPEMLAALRDQMDAYEDAWVDEAIPALGGVTPRQALEDPTRRDDLLRLLEDMERRDAALTPQRRALGMRPTRLRELLGLED